jgi:hypothetical protein
LALEGLGEGGDGVEVDLDDLDALGEGGGGGFTDDGGDGELAGVDEGLDDWLSDETGALRKVLELGDIIGGTLVSMITYTGNSDVLDDTHVEAWKRNSIGLLLGYMRNREKLT